MTAVTAITQISSETICLNEGDQDVRVVSGYLSSDMTPGTVVYLDVANNQWAALSNTTGGYTIGTVGVVGYRKRVSSTTGAVKRITDSYDVSESEDKIAPIYTSGIVIAKITDQGAALPAGTSLGASTTAGALTKVTVGTSQELATVAGYVEDDDLYAIVGIGKCKGKLWGGNHV